MSLRSFLASLEPEAIPFPLSRLYSAFTDSSVFLDFYDMVRAQVEEHVKAGRILDIGTGPGKLPIMMAGRNHMWYLVGLDLSDDMVKIASASARKEGLTNVEFKQGSADALPFKDREFDLVISTLSFHHWKKPEFALDEIYRVLREGGEAWIYDISRDIDPALFARFKRRYGFLRAWVFRLHAYTEPFYTIAQVEELAAESRFKKHGIQRMDIAYRLMLYK